MLLAAGFTGCLGSDQPPGDPAPTNESSADSDLNPAATDPGAGPTHIPVLRSYNGMVSMEGDTMCVSGGGPNKDRADGGYIAPGTTHLSVRMSNPITAFYHLEFGYVIDSNGADHQTGLNKSITWLDPVPPGQTVNQTIDVAPNQTETSPSDHRWDFYHRYTPPVDGDWCYTGRAVGNMSIYVDAVRGPT